LGFSPVVNNTPKTKTPINIMPALIKKEKNDRRQQQQQSFIANRNVSREEKIEEEKVNRRNRG
jgi:hypothetical protein